MFKLDTLFLDRDGVINVKLQNRYVEKPEEFKFISGAPEAISKLSDKTLSTEEKAQFIEQVALNNVDINALGLYTLGELRKSANKEDIKEYQIVFEKYFLKSLTSRLTDYSSSKFEVLEAEI